jgi:uncharacterized protein YhfF
MQRIETGNLSAKTPAVQAFCSRERLDPATPYQAWFFGDSTELAHELIRTSDVQVCAFDQVDARFAWDEGEGDRSLEYWRAAHWAFFSRECAELGRAPSPDMPVVLERFELLFVC